MAKEICFGSLLSGSLHFPADDARSDLSGLKVRGKLDTSLKNLTPYFARLEREIMSHRSRPHRYSTEWGRMGAGFALGAVGGVASALLGLGPLAVLKVISAAGPLGASSQLTIDTHTQKLRDDIILALRELRERLKV